MIYVTYIIFCHGFNFLHKYVITRWNLPCTDRRISYVLTNAGSCGSELAASPSEFLELHRIISNMRSDNGQACLWYVRRWKPLESYLSSELGHVDYRFFGMFLGDISRNIYFLYQLPDTEVKLGKNLTPFLWKLGSLNFENIYYWFDIAERGRLSENYA
jgi:hypothetical protein